jgi:ABC-2 type transport system permease protein
MLATSALYLRLVHAALRSQLQYRASFILALLGQLAITGIEYLGVVGLFLRFQHLGGWSLAEVSIFYGVASLSIAIADMLAWAFDHFGELLRRGDFDRMLVRPQSTVLQLAGHTIDLRKIGRLVQASVVLGFGVRGAQVQWWFLSLPLMAAAILSGAAVFFAVWWLQATLCFWSTESLELMNIVTYGGHETARYPLSIYPRALRRFFTFAVPLACTSYFPVVAALGRPDPLGTPLWAQCCAPLLGFAFLGIAAIGWRVGVHRHSSTGS